MKKEVMKQLQKMKNSVIIAMVSSRNYQKANIALIKYLTQEVNMPGVYVTLNKPYSTLKELLKKEKVDTKLIIFIDAITKTAGGNINKTKGCLFIGTPKNLSDISLAMDQAVTSLPGKNRFLFFDSLNTLLLYNEARTIARFVHFISGKMRIWNVCGIIVSLEIKGNNELIDELSQYCDVRLRL